jgi:hypothetical protein
MLEPGVYTLRMKYETLDGSLTVDYTTEYITSDDDRKRVEARLQDDRAHRIVKGTFKVEYSKFKPYKP